MKIILTLGENEKFNVYIERNQFTGRFLYIENNKTKLLRNQTDKETHFPSGNKAYYHFTVGTNEKYDIRIVHSWPERFPAFKKQTYKIFVNGEPFQTLKSY